MREKFLKKIFVIILITLFLGFTINSSGSIIKNSIEHYNNKHSEKNKQDYNDKIISTYTNVTNYYALIVTCVEYKDPDKNLPNPFDKPFSDSNLKKLYNALLNAKNWKEDNIIFLKNENATKENILLALSEFSDKITPNDIFFFSWSGHGSKIIDEDGDEKLNNPDDIYDEVICPYDTDSENNTLINVISDDELDLYFSQINAKGMCLLFESCFSGGLIQNIDIVSKNSDTKVIEKMRNSEINYIINYNNNYDTDILDIEAENRIIIMSTPPDYLGSASLLTGFNLIFVMAFSLSSAYSDRNDDNIISAEEAFKLTKLIHFLQSVIFYGSTFIYLFIFLKYELIRTYEEIPILSTVFPKIFIKLYLNVFGEFPIFSALFLTLNVYLNRNYIIPYKMHGHFCRNYVNIWDGYYGELSLIEI